MHIDNEHRALTAMLPKQFRDADIDAADRFFTEFRASSGRQPDAELLTLFAIPDAEIDVLSRWTAALTGNSHLEQALGENTRDLARAFGRIGVLGFSFPIWRFSAQRLRRADGTALPALLERAGMQRLTRNTDTMVDADGKKRDWLGTGYVRPGSEIEYRRAYLRVSVPHHGHLLIRNSSFFWGRDRFRHAAYFSPHDLPVARLLELTPADMDEKKLLLPLIAEELWNGGDDTVRENAAKLQTLVKILREFEADLSHWFFDSQGVQDASPGFRFLLENLFARMDGASPNLPYLGFINPELPPWFPYATLKVTRDLLTASEFFRTGISHQAKLVLLSGEYGDFPI